MVRLKAALSVFICACTSSFQFHYGSVKRKDSDTTRLASKVFQFHYGSVKSNMEQFNGNNFKDFNSTMVRLKGKLRL